MPAAEAEVKFGTLSDIYMTSGCTRDDDGTFRGFVTITVQASNGDLFQGQGTPEEIRTMALRWLETAEAADQDRIVMTMLTRDLKIPVKHAAGFITAMREEREGEGDVTVVPGEDLEDPVDKEYDRDERTADQEAGGAADHPVDPVQDRPDAGDPADHAEDPQELGGEG